MNHPTLRSILRFSLAFASLIMASGASAATLPVLEDSFGFRAKLTLAANKAAALPVDATHRAFLFFDLRDLPAGATIRSARLRLFLPRVVRAGSGLELRKVTSTWDETLASAEPTLEAGDVGRIPSTALRTKAFVTIDLTAVARIWLADPAGNEGLAIVATTDAVPSKISSVSISAKEGSGSGYPAELDVELDAAGFVNGIQTGTFVGQVNTGFDLLSIGQQPENAAKYEFKPDADGLKLREFVTGSSSVIFSADAASGDISLGGNGRINLNGDNSVRIDGAFTLEGNVFTNNFTANNSTCCFFCNTVNNSITITLPNPATTPLGRFYIIKKINANNSLIISSPTGTIEGASSITLTAVNDFRTVICAGSTGGWQVIGRP
jgi:hypothetical protein